MTPTEVQIQAELREILGHPNRDDEVREVHKVLNAQPNQPGLTAERIRDLVHEWFPGNNPEELFRAVMHSIDLTYDLHVETPAQIDVMPPHKQAARAAAWQRIGERLVSEAAAIRKMHALRTSARVLAHPASEPDLRNRTNRPKSTPDD